MLAGLEEGAGNGSGAVTYAMHLADKVVPLAGFIGKELTVRFTGARTCACCGKRVRKFYGQGTCYLCFRDAPEAGPCIIRPELCRAHFHEGRDVQWELDHHMQEHIVYLAYTGGVKVGVTRGTQVPVRWIDQGAVLAVPIARVPYRQLAGAIEVDLKRHFADRTDWRKMLGPVCVASGVSALVEARALALARVASALAGHMLPEEPLVQLRYPLPPVPPKLVSVQLDKHPEITGKLLGIKGQYLVWGDGLVLNVRNHMGYHVEAG